VKGICNKTGKGGERFQNRENKRRGRGCSVLTDVHGPRGVEEEGEKITCGLENQGGDLTRRATKGNKSGQGKFGGRSATELARWGLKGRT